MRSETGKPAGYYRKRDKSRDKRRDKVIHAAATAIGITMGADVMSMEELKDFPALDNESHRNQLIMCAVACGLSQPFIAKAFGVSQPTIWEIIKRIDPKGIFRISPDSKKAFITQLYTTRAMEALTSITPEKLEEMSGADLMRLAKIGTDAAQSLNQSKHKEIGRSRLDALVSEMEHDRGSVVDAEYKMSGEGDDTNK
jgi:hypothetical protein